MRRFLPTPNSVLPPAASAPFEVAVGWFAALQLGWLDFRIAHSAHSQATERCQIIGRALREQQDQDQRRPT
jgi:hypothetical protein